MKANVAEALIAIAPGWSGVEVTAITTETGDGTGFDSQGNALNYPLVTTRISGTASAFRTAPLQLPAVGKYIITLRETTTGDTKEQVLKVTNGEGSEDELSEDEKARIRLYLGYPANNRNPDWKLEGAMSAVQSNASEVALIRALLAELQAVDDGLTSSRGRQKVLKADGVELAGGQELRELNREGRRLVERLARLLAVESRGAAFGGSGVMTGELR